MKTSVALGTSQAGLGEIVWRQISSTVAEIRHGIARHRAYRALAALDDRTLEDIGVEREHIWAVVDNVLGQEPARSTTTERKSGDRAIAA